MLHIVLTVIQIQSKSDADVQKHYRIIYDRCTIRKRPAFESGSGLDWGLLAKLAKI